MLLYNEQQNIIKSYMNNNIRFYSAAKQILSKHLTEEEINLFMAGNYFRDFFFLQQNIDVVHSNMRIELNEM